MRPFITAWPGGLRPSWTFGFVAGFAVYACHALLACGGTSEESPPQKLRPMADAGAADRDVTVAPLCVETGARGTGFTFTELYKDYFGHVGPGGCAGNGRCHGSSDQPGALGSNGFICPAENEPDGKDTCYQHLRDAGLVAEADQTAPEHSPLYLVLRKSTGGGTMPKAPVCAFDEVDMKRIANWIRAGAPDN
ncbi:hypothetical protein LZC95_13095 [Pendulispora brunnea]|uniref:Cytochrome C Planctomycete-type domain-containing protein n=1 Tax=Pendulispora brunnea TaxID=2905690 RepID=A0ABZ2KGI7_9BACT